MKSALLFLTLLFFNAAWALAQTDAAKAAATSPRPNILIIFTDDQGYGDLGCQGLKTAKTPHLDRLASEGTRFTSFYTQPVCGPARSALLTGRYPSRSGGWGMPATEITFAELMQKNGYATACVGKWDVSNRKAIPERMPLQKGFDYYSGPLGANDGGNVILHENNTLLGEDKDLASLSRRYTDKSIEWLKQHQTTNQQQGTKNPFLLYLCHTMMHTVIDASPEFRDKTGNGLYADTLQELDHECGRLLAALDAMGLRENTLVIFTTDNGAWDNDMEKQNAKNSKHVPWTKGPQLSAGSNAPLREGKGSDYEGGVRVPCLVRWPGKVPAGRVNDALFATLDFMPTFAALCGFTAPQDRVLDGFDQTDLLLGKNETGNRDHYFYHSGEHGVRQGPWKLLKANRWPANFNNSYPADRGTNGVELYNLDEDISETKNLAAQHPEIVARFSALALAEEKPTAPNFGKPSAPSGGRTKVGKKKVVGASAPSGATKVATTSPKPNIILILADDMGYGDVGCFGAKDIRTPHLDKMAAEGLKLTSFYAQPICGPSRAALMTGCYPIRIGEVKNGKNGHTLPHTKEVFIAEMLRDAGYRTGIVGKWHLGMGGGCDPISQGFQHANFTPAFNGATRDIPEGHKVPFMRKPGEIVRTITNQADMDTLTADCTREALEFIRTSKDAPFFLYLAYHMPHVPLGASEKFRGKSQRGLYGDVIEELDDAVGQVLAELKTLDLDQSTLVVFTSDNGPWTDQQIGDHGGSPGPFRGAKMTTWEGGWRVPGILRWPGKVRAGETSDGIAATIDLLPTFAALSGAKLPEAQLDGLDLTEFLTKPNAVSSRETFLYHNGTRLTAVRHKDWKLVFARPAGGEMPYMPAFVTGHVEASPETQLFNLQNDPTESKNLAAERPAVVKILTQLADKSRADLGDHTGPGAGSRFHEEGPRWPAAKTSIDGTPKRKAGNE